MNESQHLHFCNLVSRGLSVSKAKGIVLKKSEAKQEEPKVKETKQNKSKK